MVRAISECGGIRAAKRVVGTREEQIKTIQGKDGHARRSKRAYYIIYGWPFLRQLSWSWG